MKASPKAIGILVLFGALASGSAMAEHGGRGHGYGHGGGVRFGISLGLPIYAPAYYSAPYFGYPAYTYPALPYTYPAPAYTYPAPAYSYPAGPMGSASPPVYVEQGVAQAPPAQAQGDWYYCAAANAYYPYVTQCPAGWQRVPAQPSSR